jgi:polysaccharide biosynthesis/export protein
VIKSILHDHLGMRETLLLRSAFGIQCRALFCALVVSSLLVSGCSTTENGHAMEQKVPPFAAEAQPPATLSPNSVRALAEFEASPSRGYQLGPGDVVDVTLWGHPELSGKQTIGPDGRIQIPFVNSLKISDLTADQAGEYITRAVSDDYIGAVATVQIEEYTDNQILVLGHVATPGVIHFTDQPTLLEALARASGGTKESSLTRCAVFRGSDRMVWIDLRPLLRGEYPMLNIRLRRNDVVYIPDPSDELIYVMGQVSKPGAYPLTPNMSFLEALASAGGPTDAAQPGQIILARPSQHTEQVVDLRDYLKGKDTQNYALNRGDIVYVPKNGLAKVGWVLQQIGPLTTSVLFGAAFF